MTLREIKDFLDALSDEELDEEGHLMNGEFIIGDFDVMKHMANHSEPGKLVVLPTFISADQDKKGGQITMGVPAKTFNEFFVNAKDWIAILYLINYPEFQKVSKLLGREL